MIEIHWLLLVFICMIAGTGGYFCCALMVMAKSSDMAIDTGLLQAEIADLRETIYHRDQKIQRLEQQVIKAGSMEG